MLKRLLFLLGCTIISYFLQAQDSSSEEHFIDSAANFAIASYHQFTDKQSRLYNGLEHPSYLPTIKDIAYYLTPNWQTGSVVYDGILYQPVTMMYDLYKDEVIIRHYNGVTMFSLLSEKVKEFTIANHHFIRIHLDSLVSSSVPTGFYDQLYSGSTSVLVKRIKLLKEKITYQVEQEFVLANQYYIYKDGIYHSIRTFNGLMNAMGENSAQIRHYLRKNKIKFNRNPENALVQAALYNDTLKK